MVRSYAISYLKTRDLGSLFNNDAGKFVPENPWRRDKAILNFFEIRSADAAGVYPDEDLTRGNLRHGNIFQRNQGFPPGQDR